MPELALDLAQLSAVKYESYSLIFQIALVLFSATTLVARLGFKSSIILFMSFAIILISGVVPTAIFYVLIKASAQGKDAFSGSLFLGCPANVLSIIFLISTAAWLRLVGPGHPPAATIVAAKVDSGKTSIAGYVGCIIHAAVCFIATNYLQYVRLD